MPYKDEVIHFTGGVHEYVGQLDQATHKMGKNWYRILNPCLLVNQTAPDGRQRTGLMAIQGQGDFFKRYVDIRIPDDSIIEIRTLDKGGDLYEAWEKEHQRKKSKIIQAPGGLKLV